MDTMTRAEAIAALNSGQWMVYRDGETYVGIRRADAATVQAAIRNTLQKQGPLTEGVLYNRVGRAHILTPMAFRGLLEMADGLTLVANKWIISQAQA